MTSVVGVRLREFLTIVAEIVPRQSTHGRMARGQSKNLAAIYETSLKKLIFCWIAYVEAFL